MSSAGRSRALSLPGFVAEALRRAAAVLPAERRKLGAIGAGAAIVLVLLAWLSAGPIVRHAAESRAEARGLRLSVREAHLGFGTVRLGGVTVSSPEVPGATARFSRVEIGIGITGAVRRAGIHGGSVTLAGSAEQLEKEIRAYRKAHARPANGGGSGRTTPLSVDGIDITWSLDAAASVVEHVWGARYDRSESGGEHVGFDLARVSTGSVRVEASKATASFEHDGSARKLTAVNAAHVATVVDLSGDDTPRATRSSGSLAQGSSQPGAGTGAPPSGGLPPSEAGRFRRLREELGRAATASAEMIRPGTALALPDVRFEIHHAGQVLNVGPANAVVERTADSVKASVISAAGEHAPPIRFDIAVPLRGGAVDVGLAGGPISLAALGVKERDMGLEAVDRAAVEVNGRARLEGDGSRAHLSGAVRLSDLSLFQPRLSKEPIRGLELGVRGDAELALDGSRLRVSGMDVDVGKVKLVASGELERSEGHARGSLHLEIPLAACSDMLESVPSGLVPLLPGLEVSGTFALSGNLTFDTRRPKDTRVAGNGENGCRITKVPASLSTDRFFHPWARTVLDTTGVPVTIESGPGTRDWVPLPEISPYVATAVVVCEDANFWTHNGFNRKSIEDSIRDDLTAGRFVRGGSTVTMQLAKNLYLKREKTLSRKLQEAVLTMLLEQSLTKDQILELYLNVIEFAPGLYGIGPAADYYFHSTPRDLSLGQALYLVSLLPNPKIQHFKPDGALSDRWADYLRHLMDIAHKIRRIDDGELAAGLAEQVHRGVAANDGAAWLGSDTDPDAPPDEFEPEGP